MQDCVESRLNYYRKYILFKKCIENLSSVKYNCVLLDKTTVVLSSTFLKVQIIFHIGKNANAHFPLIQDHRITESKYGRGWKGQNHNGGENGKG